MKKLFEEVPFLEGRNIIIRGIDSRDIEALQELVSDEAVYRYLPTFLYEKQNDDLDEVIDGFYGDQFTSREGIIMAIVLKGEESLCGLIELYGFKDYIHKISMGYRLLSRYWGRGIASEAVGLLVEYLYGETDIEIITASTMIENKASERVLEKNDFLMTAVAVPEDWGFPEPTIADKWFR